MLSQSGKPKSDEKYRATELEDIFRRQLSNIVYAWSKLFPEPMTKFSKDICAKLPRKEVDEIVVFLKAALTDSNNLRNTSDKLSMIVERYPNLQDKSILQILKECADLSKNIEQINELKLIQSVATRVHSRNEILNITKLNAEPKSNELKITTSSKSKIEVQADIEIKTKTKVEESAINNNPACSQVIINELNLIRGGNVGSVIGAIIMRQIDTIIRNGNLYGGNDVENEKKLQESFDIFNKDLQTLAKLSQIYEEKKAILITSPDDTDYVKELTDMCMKYPAQKPENIIANIERFSLNTIREIIKPAAFDSFGQIFKDLKNWKRKFEDKWYDSSILFKMCDQEILNESNVKVSGVSLFACHGVNKESAMNDLIIAASKLFKSDDTVVSTKILAEKLLPEIAVLIVASRGKSIGIKSSQVETKLTDFINEQGLSEKLKEAVKECKEQKHKTVLP